jgi:hypothetical protein
VNYKKINKYITDTQGVKNVMMVSGNLNRKTSTYLELFRPLQIIVWATHNAVISMDVPGDLHNYQRATHSMPR